jgi:hypothetical protein
MRRPGMVDANDSKAEIGYKKPPRHTQFKRGVSGNAKGRPRGAKNFATVIEEELRARIEVTENGKRKRISKREAIAKQTVNRAAAGDPKATSTLLNEARFQENQNQPSGQRPVASPEDQMVMNNILQRIRLSQLSCLDGESVPEPTNLDHPTPPPQSDEGGV